LLRKKDAAGLGVASIRVFRRSEGFSAVDDGDEIRQHRLDDGDEIRQHRLFYLIFLAARETRTHAKAFGGMHACLDLEISLATTAVGKQQQPGAE